MSWPEVLIVADHRHYKGKVTTAGLESFEQIEARFEEEWNKLAKEIRRAQD